MMTLGTIQEEEPPNRGIPGTGLEKSTETAKYYQEGERGQEADQQRQDKRLAGTGEQGTFHPISFIPHIAHCPHMHGSPN